jgi:hypothetical protein
MAIAILSGCGGGEIGAPPPAAPMPLLPAPPAATAAASPPTEALPTPAPESHASPSPSVGAAQLVVDPLPIPPASSTTEGAVPSPTEPIAPARSGTLAPAVSAGACRALSRIRNISDSTLFAQVQKGWPRARVLKNLGEPTSCKGKTWTYVAGLPTGPEETYVFTFVNEIVVGIEQSGVACRMF